MTRDEAIQVLANFYVSTKNPMANHLCEAIYIAIQALKNEPKHGHWQDEVSGRDSVCTVCGRYWIPSDAKYDFKYCPNCGNLMDGEENG